MINLKLESWSALAPGLEDDGSWRAWFSEQSATAPTELSPPNLKEIPPLLRRRFTTLGKFAARSALELKRDNKKLSTVYASRHGDTLLTLSLLENIGRNEALSPTSFSLAVHNAVGGLLSIAKKDQSPMTAIASKQSLVLSTLHEAIAQLQTHEQVLCVIYDVPLPAIYMNYSDSLPFPVAVAFVLGKNENEGVPLTLQHNKDQVSDASSEQGLLDFIRLLTGIKQQIQLPFRKQHWLLSRGRDA